MNWLSRRATRRRFLSMLRAVGLSAAALEVSSRLETDWQPPAASASADSPPVNTATPIEHFMCLMQENRSFDHYFGKYPGADGIPADVSMPFDPNDANSERIAPFYIRDIDVELRDPDHNRDTSLLQYNQGKMDGFVYALTQKNQDGRLAMAHYDERDLPFYWNVADEYVLFDRFFTSAATSSFVNHVFWVAAQAGTEGDHIPQGGLPDMPTIFDRLNERGVSWKFYVQNYDPNITYRTADSYPPDRASQAIWVPLLTMNRYIDDPELFAHIVSMEEYFLDLQNGTLPAVAYLVPSGPSEHPPQTPQAGQRFVRSLINELMRSDYWNKSAFMWTYDDWGGWYDHVPPPQVDEHGYGFRAPALLVSPYARTGHIDSTILDFTSILRFIEDNWTLAPLAERDARANSIVSAFDFTQTPRAPRFISAQRGENKATASRRSLLYLLYGLGLLLPGLLITWVARPRSTHDSPGPVSGRPGDRGDGA